MPHECTGMAINLSMYHPELRNITTQAIGSFSAHFKAYVTYVLPADIVYVQNHG